ncbi:MAG: hypothetical protein HYR84_00125 [Planctomycetes bacterium]|nr:hypothetical protein [Planctomycetota bacterium]
MIEIDEERLLVNIRQPDTDDLLDRVTAFRKGMEPVAIALTEKELHRREVTAAQIAAHREACERDCLFHEDGVAKKCSYCRKPAVRQAIGWQKLWRLIPLFPCEMFYCYEHAKTHGVADSAV